MPERRSPSPRLDREELELWRSLIRVSQLLPAALEAGLAAEGETLSRYEILAVLATVPEGLRLNELGRFALVSKPRLTVHVASLESDGFVSREPDPNDGRASLVRLTSPGRRHLASLAPGHLGLARKLAIDCIAPSDREAVRRSLEAMLRALGDA